MKTENEQFQSHCLVTQILENGVAKDIETILNF